MFSKTVLVSALLAVPYAVSAAQAQFNNFCPKSVCVYTTQPGGGAITNSYTIQPNGYKTIPYPAPGATGSQVRVSPDCNPNDDVYWEFSVGNDGNVYYDVNIEGPSSDPFSVRGLGVTGSSSACPSISCPPGSTTCFNNPNGHQQNQVKACAASNSIFFNACRP